jgi:hypothetical protein
VLGVSTFDAFAMTKTFSRLPLGALIALLGLSSPCGRAVTLDWDTAAWTAGALTGSFDVDATNPGNDITVTISGSTGNFAAGAPANVSYNANAFGAGLSSTDGGTGQKTLNTRLDWTNNTSTLTFTITFNYTGGVYLQQLGIFDIDRTSATGTTWIDQITNIYGTTPIGGIVGPSAITDDVNTQITGSGTNYVITGTNNGANNTSGGNAYLNFGAQKVTQVTFTWKNAAGTDANPASQIISLFDIIWTPTPEVGSSLAALLLCGGIAGTRPFRRRHVR